jgi:hypothetical protein
LCLDRCLEKHLYYKYFKVKNPPKQVKKGVLLGVETMPYSSIFIDEQSHGVSLPIRVTVRTRKALKKEGAAVFTTIAVSFFEAHWLMWKTHNTAFFAVLQILLCNKFRTPVLAVLGFGALHVFNGVTARCKGI